jgi:3-oxoacid CoA-transferase
VLIACASRNAFLTTARAPRRLARQYQSSAPRCELQKPNTGAKRDPAPKVVRGGSKIYRDADAAVADLKSGSTILSAGFGLCGTAGRSSNYCKNCFGESDD